MAGKKRKLIVFDLGKLAVNDQIPVYFLVAFFGSTIVNQFIASL